VTIVRVGTTKKYSEGWEKAFGKGKKAPPEATSKSVATPKKKAAKKPAKASAKKKSSAKKGKK
jgi:hypothetical protein